MTPSEDIQGVVTHGLNPGGWIAIGLAITLIGAFVTVGTGDSGWVILAAIPGGVMLWIGVIAKGVEVGLRFARRD